MEFESFYLVERNNQSQVYLVVTIFFGPATKITHTHTHTQWIPTMQTPPNDLTHSLTHTNKQHDITTHVRTPGEYPPLYKNNANCRVGDIRLRGVGVYPPTYRNSHTPFNKGEVVRGTVVVVDDSN